MNPFRPPLLLSISLLCAAFSAQAADVTPPASSQTGSSAAASDQLALTPELEQALAAELLPFWSHDESVSLKAGWCENPLLSSYASVGRGFAGAKIESFVWHLPMGGHWEGGAMLDGDVERYLDPLPGAAGNQHWFVHGELRWLPVKPFRLTLSPEVYYFDQVLDLSQTAAERYVLPVKVLGARAKLVARQNLGSSFAVEAGATVGVARYRRVPENNTEPGGLARAIWTPNKEWTFEVGGEIKRRSYSEREETTAAGRSLRYTRLHFLESMADAKVARNWTVAGGTLEASVKAHVFANRDEAHGFYDFNLVGMTGSFEWSRGPWTVDVDVDASHTRYLVQTVGAGLAPPQRRRNDYDGTLHVERDFGKVIGAYVEVEREASLTNLENASYHNLIATGAIKIHF